MIEIVGVIVWPVSGWLSVDYWWRKEFRETPPPICQIIGCVLGPFAFILGWATHHNHC